VDALGTDLVLLAIDTANGRIHVEYSLRYGLMGSELVRLAAAGRIDIADDRIVATEPASRSTGDLFLDTALDSIASARRPPRPSAWVGRPRPQIVSDYLARLGDWAVIVPGRRGLHASWRIVNEPAAASVRSRLDTVSFGSGMISFEEAALAGLVHAIRLDHVLYPGRQYRDAHMRLKEVATGQWTASAVQRAISSVNAAQQAMMHAASNAAMQAATQAAMQAAMSAALQATISATTSSPPT
jgi:Golgi phosphoprotein 3 (GPP34)